MWRNESEDVLRLCFLCLRAVRWGIRSGAPPSQLLFSSMFSSPRNRMRERSSCLWEGGWRCRGLAVTGEDQFPLGKRKCPLNLLTLCTSSKQRLISLPSFRIFSSQLEESLLIFPSSFRCPFSGPPDTEWGSNLISWTRKLVETFEDTKYWEGSSASWTQSTQPNQPLQSTQWLWRESIK